MRAFVGGATGLTGREVVAELAQRGVEVHAHVRPDSTNQPHWLAHFGGMGVTVDNTPWDAAQMVTRLTELQPDLVFGLLGTTKKRMKADDASYESVDYGMTVMLINGAVAADSGTRFVYLSAVGSGPNAKGAYMKARSRVERHLKDSGLKYTVARPSFILGARDTHRSFESVGAGVVDGGLKLVKMFGGKKLAGRYSSMQAADLARAMVHLALNPEQRTQICDANRLRLVAGRN